MRPAQLLLLRSVDTSKRFARPLCALLVPRFGDVEQTCEHQVGNLLDDSERVCDAARPEFFPELVDLAFELSRNHCARLLSGSGVNWTRMVASSSTSVGSVKTP